jgi:hypothetical protein
MTRFLVNGKPSAFGLGFRLPGMKPRPKAYGLGYVGLGSARPGLGLLPSSWPSLGSCFATAYLMVASNQVSESVDSATVEEEPASLHNRLEGQYASRIPRNNLHVIGKVFLVWESTGGP